MHLRLYVTRAQILYEQSFKRNTTMLDPSRKDDQDDDNQSDSYHQRISETAEVIADIEDESNRNHHTHKNGKYQRQAVAVILCPKRPELLATILLHHHCSQEWGNDKNRQHTRYGISIPMEFPSRQQFAHKRKHESEHHRNGCRCKNRIDHSINCHLGEQLLPLTLLLRMMTANRYLIQRVDEFVGQVRL